MRRFIAASLFAILFVALPAIAQTQEKKEPEHKMVEFHMALLKHGPKYSAEGMSKEMQSAHIANVMSLLESGQAVIAGPLVAEMHPWWSEDVMKKPNSPVKLTTAYLALLTRGAKWTPEVTPATQEIQKGHMANINRLAAMKKLVVAGPFGDNGQLRGIFVFKVASLEEARVLTETDPAVQAGRLALDIHPWLVPEGVLP
jgi:uncharacterized protein YciI